MTDPHPDEAVIDAAIDAHDVRERAHELIEAYDERTRAAIDVALGYRLPDAAPDAMEGFKPRGYLSQSGDPCGCVCPPCRADLHCHAIYCRTEPCRS